MEYKSVLKIFVMAIFIIGTLNFAYADSGPEIGSNQIQKIAQDYLDSHNLPYIATTPNDKPKYLIIDKRAGKMEWIPNGEEKPTLDNYVIGATVVYDVPLNDKNGKNIGKIYVDVEDMTGNIVEVILFPSGLNDLMTSFDGVPYSTNFTNINIVTPLNVEKSSDIGLSDVPEETFYDISQLAIIFISGILLGVFIGGIYWKLGRNW